MRFQELELAGAFLITVEERADDRGFFARSFCTEEFAAHGLPTAFPQCNVSFNPRAGTLRGLHFQAEPRPDPKLVRCTRGAIFDVMVDLRPTSPSFCRWAGATLSADNHAALYVPPGFAHGFLTLSDEAEVFYMMGDTYVAELARGVRWDDPAFAIAWPAPPASLSERDASYPDFQPSGTP